MRLTLRPYDMRIALTIILLLATSVAALAADGKKLYAESACATCHGATGNEPILPTYPKVAGQNREYLIRQLNDIKSGARDNGASITMQGLMTNLSEDDITAIADYLSGL